MNVRRRVGVLYAAGLLLVGCAFPLASSDQRAQPIATATAGNWTLHLVPVAQDFVQPVHVTHAGDDSGRLFVVEKAGRIRIVRDDVVQPDPFLDITNLVRSSSSEQGLLSVAFHPRYKENGFFYVDYTDQSGDTVIARFRAAPDADRGDAASATTLLTIEQPAANHNGGQIAFGPDGFLYIGMGDGGGAGDVRGNAQNPAVLLGKMLRIDVDGAEPYGIPSDNPFVRTEGARPEIWATGLRNPWRFSFDRMTGDMFIADVGQNRLEEINIEPAKQGGLNYGWNVMEGRDCYQPSSGCEQNGMVQPIADYAHDQGCSVTGGFRYRGQTMPAFGDAYFFGDYCSGNIWSLTSNGEDWTMTALLDTDLTISSFGEDEQGELYVVDMNDGGLYHLNAKPATP